jgi:hypothetical protein
MQPFETGNVGFSARLLHNGIHEFTWISPSREAVDVWIEYCEGLYEITPTDSTLYYIHIAQSAMFPPFSYLMRKARELQQKFPEQPKTRSAVLFQSRFFGGMVNNVTRMLNKEGLDFTRFFGMDEREQAIEWLLSDVE